MTIDKAVSGPPVGFWLDAGSGVPWLRAAPKAGMSDDAVTALIAAIHRGMRKERA